MRRHLAYAHSLPGFRARTITLRRCGDPQMRVVTLARRTLSSPAPRDPGTQGDRHRRDLDPQGPYLPYRRERSVAYDVTGFERDAFRENSVNSAVF